MKCPSCKADLKPTKLEGELPVLGCEKCAGALIPLLYYRDWAERHPVHPAEPLSADVPVEADDSRSALACPKCSRIMTKFRVASGLGNRVDLCASCDEAWLDSGEWMLLKKLELSRQLPAVFTDAWQRKLKREINDDARRQRYVKLIGADAMAEADRMRAWIAKHPRRHEILAYLSFE